LNNDDTKPLDDTTTIRQIPSTSQQQEPVSQTKGERNWLDNFISQIGDQLQDISYIEILTTSAKDPARVLRKAGKQDILNELENQPFLQLSYLENYSHYWTISSYSIYVLKKYF
jgi:hypothetical protein